MNIENIEKKKVTGLSLRTTNATEMNPSTGQIPALWQRFDDNVEVNYKEGSRVYGVYFDYESDATGEFTVLAGTDQTNIDSKECLESIEIQSGKYLVFQAKGEMPQIAIETWSKVWEYFSCDEAEYKRTFTTDFEYYVNQNEIKVYIAVG